MKRLQQTWHNNPLPIILGMAILLRLIAVIWAKGFGMHDDHFLVIEAAQSWVDGGDYNNWLPNESGTNTPQGHSFFYVGLHYYLFLLLEAIGLHDPAGKMFIVRFLHASLSLITVWIGFLLAKRYTCLRNAKLVGLLLAAYWFMPWLSVRNLVEVVCIPFLLTGSYIAIKADEDHLPWYWYILAGALMGVAFNIRYQTAIFAMGVFLALWIHKKWLGGLLAGAGFLLIAIMVQGVPDYIIWGQAFVEFQEYIRYNLTHSGDYISSPWYTYLLLILGILIPPTSLFLFTGFLAGWRKHLLIVIPVSLFLLFHSIFPNKQERFILPIIPFIIIAGVTGWEQMGTRWKSIMEGRRFRSTWVFFWIITLIILPVVSSMYSKRARVESMRYLAAYPNITTILLDERLQYGTKYPPEFYLEQWVSVIERDRSVDQEALKDKLSHFAPEHLPRFVLFTNENDLVERVLEVQEILPGIVFETRIRPGIVDAFLHWLNPNNANQSIFIYRNTEFYPRPLSPGGID